MDSESELSGTLPLLHPFGAATSGTAFRQGEILANLPIYKLAISAVDDDTNDRLAPVQYRFAVILSQDCDLDQDFAKREKSATEGDRSLLPNILICEAVQADVMRQNLRTHGQGKEIWKGIEQNQNVRYQFLEAVLPACDSQSKGLPALVLDFKRYCTVPTDELYSRARRGTIQRRCIMHSPWLEQLGSRFSYFLSRVALPRDHARPTGESAGQAAQRD